MKKAVLWVIIGLVVVGLLIQLIPLPGRGNNPPVTSEPPWDSPQTRALAKRACFDCHSNESRWPLYAYVAPVSWLIYNDVMGGRSRMNFSEWNRGFQPSIGEIVGELQEGGMPPAIYLPMHPNAQLTAAEKQQLITGLTNSLK
ncbi:MAG: heme-binding domain-containing protein [Chloroflexi bacterium]|nr:heme-binding domain-containing protein [Chloroflexota bacterium]